MQNAHVAGGIFALRIIAAPLIEALSSITLRYGFAVAGGDYFYQDVRLGHTGYSHSRFDFDRPEVQQYLCANVMRWLVMRFVDGLRFYPVINIRGIQHNGAYECDDANGAALLRRINQQVQASQQWKLTIATDLQGWDQITALVANGGFGLSAHWNEVLCYWNWPI